MSVKANEIYKSILQSVPDIRIYETQIGRIIDSKKYSSFTERISLEEQIWNRCMPDKELANEVYDLFCANAIKAKDNDLDDRTMSMINTLIQVGYGWGKFAQSVLSSGKATPKQKSTLENMIHRVHINSVIASGFKYINSRRSHNVSDDDYEEADLCGFDGHGF